jgi:hypothetical protein
LRVNESRDVARTIHNQAGLGPSLLDFLLLVSTTSEDLYRTFFQSRGQVLPGLGPGTGQVAGQKCFTLQ